jgi:hypothetical protein
MNEYIQLLVKAENTTNRADAIRLINRATELLTNTAEIRPTMPLNGVSGGMTPKKG